jgi:hypothetical protein
MYECIAENQLKISKALIMIDGRSADRLSVNEWMNVNCRFDSCQSHGIVVTETDTYIIIMVVVVVTITVAVLR